MIDSADHHEPQVAAHRRPFQIGIAGLDVIRDEDGRFLVLEDNVRTPSGFAYMLAARRATAARYGADADLRRRRGARSPSCCGATLRAAAPPGVDEPVVALLTDGDRNSAWWEHQELARLTGARLLLTNECEVHHGHLCRRDEHARLHPVDVVYRRTDEDRLADAHGRLTAVGELLDGPLRAGTVTCVNAFGTGVADDKLVHAYVEDMIRFYLGEEPLLRSVTTYDLEDPGVPAGGARPPRRARRQAAHRPRRPRRRHRAAGRAATSCATPPRRSAARPGTGSRRRRSASRGTPPSSTGACSRATSTCARSCSSTAIAPGPCPAG